MSKHLAKQGAPCPECKGLYSAITDSRSKDTHIHRRRKCLDCAHRWSTSEIPTTELERLMNNQNPIASVMVTPPALNLSTIRIAFPNQ